MKGALLILGRGIGQVMFQNNALSGLLMLVGILLNSWQMALLAIAGNVVSTLAAYFSGYSREDIRNGLYGFNGTLVVSGFTAPFIISVWILLVACNWMMPSLLLPSGDAVTAQTLSFLQAFCLNIGQVMFQGNTVLAGVFFLLGILVNSRINGLYTILGALLPIPFALLLGVDYAALNAGLMGYNGVLCAIALGDKTWKGGVWAVMVVLLSVLLQIGGMEWGITTLTAPFVVAVWIVAGLQQLDRKAKTETANG